MQLTTTRPSPAPALADGWTPLCDKRILEHFAASRSWERIDEYCSQAEDMLPNELPVLVWLDWAYEGSLNTIRLYARYVANLINYNKCDFSQIRDYDIKAFLNHLAAQGMKKSSMNTVLAAIKSFYKFLHGKNIVQFNPAAVIKKKRGQENTKKMRTFSQNEMDTLRRYLNKHAPFRDEALLNVLYFCGLRREEAATLTWKDLHLWQDKWRLKVVGKGSKIRHVYVPAPALSLLWQYREEQFAIRPEVRASQLDDWPLFSDLRSVSRPVGADLIYRLVRKYCKEALKVTASPHWFRHTFCTHLAIRKVAIEQIKEAAGHESIETTSHYVEMANMLIAAGEAFDSDGFDF